MRSMNKRSEFRSTCNVENSRRQVLIETRIFPPKYEEGEENYIKRKPIAPFLSSNDVKEIKYRIIRQVEHI
jgi:hypothetical protein